MRLAQYFMFSHFRYEVWRVTRYLFVAGILYPFHVHAAASLEVPTFLAPIFFPGSKVAVSKLLLEAGNTEPIKPGLLGSGPAGEDAVSIPPEVRRIDLVGNAGMKSAEMFSWYRDKIIKNGGEILNRNYEKERWKYNSILLFTLRDRGQYRKIGLWINGDNAGQHYFYVWPQSKNSLPTADEMAKKIQETGAVSLYLNFDNNKSDIRDLDRPQLDQAIAMLKANPTLRLRVEGHTDNVGKGRANLDLSAARARSVVQALVAGGVAADRLKAEGFGDTKPVADNSSVDGRAKNRRVQLSKL